MDDLKQGKGLKMKTLHKNFKNLCKLSLALSALLFISACGGGGGGESPSAGYSPSPEEKIEPITKPKPPKVETEVVSSEVNPPERKPAAVEVPKPKEVAKPSKATEITVMPSYRTSSAAVTLASSSFTPSTRTSFKAPKPVGGGEAQAVTAPKETELETIQVAASTVPANADAPSPHFAKPRSINYALHSKPLFPASSEGSKPHLRAVMSIDDGSFDSSVDSGFDGSASDGFDDGSDFVALSTRAASPAIYGTNNRVGEGPLDIVLGIVDTGVRNGYVGGDYTGDHLYKNARYIKNTRTDTYTEIPYKRGYSEAWTGSYDYRGNKKWDRQDHGELVSNFSIKQSEGAIKIASVLKRMNTDIYENIDLRDESGRYSRYNDAKYTIEALSKQGVRFFNRSYGDPSQPNGYAKNQQVDDVYWAITTGNALVTNAAGNDPKLNTSTWGDYTLAENDALRRGWLNVTGYHTDEDIKYFKTSTGDLTQKFYYKDEAGAVHTVYHRGTGCGLKGYKDCVANPFSYYELETTSTISGRTTYWRTAVNSNSHRSGTSFAAPNTLVLAAKIYSNYPWMSNQNIKDLITQNAYPVLESSTATAATDKTKSLFGQGIINADASLWGPSRLDEHKFVANVNIPRAFHFYNDIKGQYGFEKSGVGTLVLRGKLSFGQKPGERLEVKGGTLALLQGGKSVEMHNHKNANLAFLGYAVEAKSLLNEGLFINDAITNVTEHFAQTNDGTFATYLGRELRAGGVAFLDGKLQILGKKDYLKDKDEIKASIIRAAKISGDFASLDYPVGYELKGSGVIESTDKQRDIYVLHFNKTNGQSNLPTLSLEENYTVAALGSFLAYEKSTEAAGKKGKLNASLGKPVNAPNVQTEKLKTASASTLLRADSIDLGTNIDEGLNSASSTSSGIHEESDLYSFVNKVMSTPRSAAATQLPLHLKSYEASSLALNTLSLLWSKDLEEGASLGLKASKSRLNGLRASSLQQRFSYIYKDESLSAGLLLGRGENKAHRGKFKSKSRFAQFGTFFGLHFEDMGAKAQVIASKGKQEAKFSTFNLGLQFEAANLLESEVASIRPLLEYDFLRLSQKAYKKDEVELLAHRLNAHVLGLGASFAHDLGYFNFKAKALYKHISGLNRGLDARVSGEVEGGESTKGKYFAYKTKSAKIKHGAYLGLNAAWQASENFSLSAGISYESALKELGARLELGLKW